MVSLPYFLDKLTVTFIVPDQTFIPKGASKDKDSATKDFIYDQEKDIILCPNNKELTFRTFKTRNGSKKYSAKKIHCDQCPMRSTCLSPKAKSKDIVRAFHKSASETQNRANGSNAYLEAMKLRKIFSEGNFAHQKARHNLSRTNKRGLCNATMHGFLSATAFNLTRMVKLSFV